MARRKVWRVEHPADDGGPYGSYEDHERYELANRLMRAHGWDEVPDLHPSPWEDGDLRHPLRQWQDDFNEASVRFGFVTQKQLKAWFGGWGRLLEGAGYVVRCYDVAKDRVAHSDLQAIFVRDEDATVVKEILPTKVLTSV